MTALHAASREALATLRERLDAVVGQRPDATVVATDLHAVAGLLEDQPRLRRVLADPTTGAQGRAELAGRLFGSQLSAEAVEVVRSAVSQRWSSPWDLVDGLETAGNDALFITAERQRVLDRVEEELFRFERVLDVSGDLTTLLDEVGVPAQRRLQLLGTLINDKVHRITRALLEQTVRSRRRRSIVLAIDDLLDSAAARRNRSIARVVSAVELTAEQLRRLETTLSEIYGRPITVRVAVEPEVRGGLVVRVADEVIDGSVASRLAQARAALAGTSTR